MLPDKQKEPNQITRNPDYQPGDNPTSLPVDPNEITAPVRADTNVPGQVQYGTLRLPEANPLQGPPATIPLGGGSETYALGPVEDTTREGKNEFGYQGMVPTAQISDVPQPRMPPVNSGNYQAQAEAAKGQEVKSSPDSGKKSSDNQDDDDEDENGDEPKVVKSKHPAPPKPPTRK